MRRTLYRWRCQHAGWVAMLAALVACVRATGTSPSASPVPAPGSAASVSTVTVTPPDAPGPLDRSALAQIDQAIEELYLAGRESDAEAQLKGVYQACATRCSPGVRARAWMYVGVIWGNGTTQRERAREAFRFALTLDPELTLDEALASPGTRRSFELEQAAVNDVPPAPDGEP